MEQPTTSPSRRVMVLYVLLIANLVIIFLTFFSPLISIFGGPNDWPVRALLLYGGLAAFGGLSALIGLWTTAQNIRGKHAQPRLLGPGLILLGLIVTVGFWLYLGLLESCWARNTCL